MHLAITKHPLSPSSPPLQPGTFPYASLTCHILQSIGRYEKEGPVPCCSQTPSRVLFRNWGHHLPGEFTFNHTNRDITRSLTVFWYVLLAFMLIPGRKIFILCPPPLLHARECRLPRHAFDSKRVRDDCRRSIRWKSNRSSRCEEGPLWVDVVDVL